MKLSSLRVPVILGLATACSGENDPGEFASPSVALTFPPPVSSTDAESITVRGTASDLNGVGEVRVNGVLASTTDGFATWQADVPLANGMNTLTVAASDSHGNTNTRAAEARIESQPLLLWPTAIAVDPSSPLAFLLDSGPSVKSVDLMSGARAIVSDALHGTGPPLSGGRGIALDGGRALVASSQNFGGFVIASVIAVDPMSGDRTIVSDDTLGMGPSFGLLLGITVDGDRALVTSHLPMVSGSGAVVAVDLVSGDRTILSGATAGSGPGLRTPEGIVVDGGRALVLDRSLTALVAVDLASGDRTIVSDASTGTGPVFSPYQKAITLDGDRALVVDGGLDAIIAVDLVNGDRTFLGIPPAEPVIPNLTAIALDVTDGTRVLVTHVGHRAVQGVDLASGERTFVSPPTSVGTGPSIKSRVIALEGDLALVRGEGESSLVAVDLASGARRIVSDSSTGTGPRFRGPDAVALDGGRAIVLASNPGAPDSDDDMALFAVDLASGDRSIVSDSSTGAGRPLGEDGDIALAGNRVLTLGDGVIAVDLASGDRTIVSNRTRGQGPHFLDHQPSIVLDGNRAIVADESDTNFRLVAVDLASGDRSIVSGEFTGQGPMFRDTDDLLLDGDRVLVVARLGIFTVDLATGDRTILSGFSTGLGPIQPEGIARSGDRVYVTDHDLGAIVAVDPRTGQRTIVAR